MHTHYDKEHHSPCLGRNLCAEGGGESLAVTHMVAAARCSPPPSTACNNTCAAHTAWRDTGVAHGGASGSRGLRV